VEVAVAPQRADVAEPELDGLAERAEGEVGLAEERIPAGELVVGGRVVRAGADQPAVDLKPVREPALGGEGAGLGGQRLGMVRDAGQELVEEVDLEVERVLVRGRGGIAFRPAAAGHGSVPGTGGWVTRRDYTARRGDRNDRAGPVGFRFGLVPS